MKVSQKDKQQLKEKESLLRDLAAILDSSGYRVRREKLKQGHGWRAVSGSCRVLSKHMVFLDRRLSADDQIDFLVESIATFGIKVAAERKASLPPSIAQRVLSADPEDELLDTVSQSHCIKIESAAI